MARVNSSDVQKAISICDQATEVLNTTAANLSSKVTEAGSSWNDDKYSQLETIINQCIAALNTPRASLESTKSTLIKLQQVIAEYEQA